MIHCVLETPGTSSPILRLACARVPLGSLHWKLTECNVELSRWAVALNFPRYRDDFHRKPFVGTDPEVAGALALPRSASGGCPATGLYKTPLHVVAISVNSARILNSRARQAEAPWSVRATWNSCRSCPGSPHRLSCDTCDVIAPIPPPFVTCDRDFGAGGATSFL